MKINTYDVGFIGMRIRQARKSKGYTQEQVSEMIKMSPKNFSQLERGLTGLSTSTLISICKALDISADYILFGILKSEENNAINSMLSTLSESEQLFAEKLLAVYVESCRNTK